MQEALATITFNRLAVREVFTSDRAKGLRLRIDRGVVTFRAATPSTGADVIGIERDARGILVSLAPPQRRLLQRLFKAGLSREQPYFVLEPAHRGWFGIAHHPFDHPPQRQPAMLVAGFDLPAEAIDMPTWRRFDRALVNNRTINPDQWQMIYRMTLNAVRLVAHPQQTRTQDRLLARRLLNTVETVVSRLVALAERQPEIASELLDMITQVTGETPTLAHVIAPRDLPNPRNRDLPNPRNEEQTSPRVNRSYVRRVLNRPNPNHPQARHRIWPTVAGDEQEPSELPAASRPPKPLKASPQRQKPEPRLPKSTNKSRPWPRIAPVELEPEELPSEQMAKLAVEQAKQPAQDASPPAMAETEAPVAEVTDADDETTADVEATDPVTPEEMAEQDG